MKTYISLALFGGLLWAAPPVIAQDIEFTPDATLACLETSITPAEQFACVGHSAAECSNLNEMGGTTIGIAACFGAEYVFWDARLNTSYQAALAQAVETDAEMKEIGATAEPLVAALKAMQRAWIPYRDAACAYERAQWGSGTGSGGAVAECLMRLTAAQTMLIEGTSY